MWWALLGLYLVARGSAIETCWLLSNVLSTLRALKARKRIRRKLVKQCCVDWIAWVVISNALPIPDAALSWLPMYGVVRMATMVGFLLLRQEMSLILVTAIRSRFKPYERSIDLAISLIYSTTELALHYATLPFVTRSYPSVDQVEQVMTPMPIRSARPRKTPLRPKSINQAVPRRAMHTTASTVNFDDSWIAPSPLAGPSRRRMERNGREEGMVRKDNGIDDPSSAAQSTGPTSTPKKTRNLPKRSDERVKRPTDVPEVKSKRSTASGAAADASTAEKGATRPQTVGKKRQPPSAPIPTKIRRRETAPAKPAGRKRPLEEDTGVTSMPKQARIVGRVEDGIAKRRT